MTGNNLEYKYTKFQCSLEPVKKPWHILLAIKRLLSSYQNQWNLVKDTEIIKKGKLIEILIHLNHFFSNSSSNIFGAQKLYPVSKESLVILMCPQDFPKWLLSQRSSPFITSYVETDEQKLLYQKWTHSKNKQNRVPTGNKNNCGPEKE